MTKLIYPREKTMSTIILLGVKRRTMIHASYVYDFLETLNPEVVFIEQAPDAPLFIKTKPDETFQQRWFSFLKLGKDSRFHVASKP
jgi:hypothetical protein